MQLYGKTKFRQRFDASDPLEFSCTRLYSRVLDCVVSGETGGEVTALRSCRRATEGAAANYTPSAITSARKAVTGGLERAVQPHLSLVVVTPTIWATRAAGCFTRFHEAGSDGAVRSRASATSDSTVGTGQGTRRSGAPAVS